MRASACVCVCGKRSGLVRNSCALVCGQRHQIRESAHVLRARGGGFGCARARETEREGTFELIAFQSHFVVSSFD